MLDEWTTNVRHMYHRVILQHEQEPIVYSDADGPNHFTEQRFLKLLQLRQNALQEARNQWADYILVCSLFFIFTSVLERPMNVHTH